MKVLTSNGITHSRPPVERRYNQQSDVLAGLHLIQAARSPLWMRLRNRLLAAFARRVLDQ